MTKLRLLVLLFITLCTTFPASAQPLVRRGLQATKAFRAAPVRPRPIVLSQPRVVRYFGHQTVPHLRPVQISTPHISRAIARASRFPLAHLRPLNLPGLKNAYQVSNNLYRGALPTRQGYEALAKMGIKTIINLRVSEPDKALTEGLPLTVYHIPVNPFLFNDRHAKRFLGIASNPANYPIYVHCLYGSDRTGAMVALYRVKVQHWPKERALQEMFTPAFGFDEVFFPLTRYIENL